MAATRVSPQPLSAEQRELVRRLVGKQGIQLAGRQTIPARSSVFTGRAELLVSQVRARPSGPDEAGESTDYLEGDGFADGHDGSN